MDIQDHPLTHKVADVIVRHLIQEYCQALCPEVEAMELSAYADFSPKARQFLVALEALCKEHNVLLSVSGYDALQLWDLDTEVGQPWYCNGLQDMTIPEDTAKETPSGA